MYVCRRASPVHSYVNYIYFFGDKGGPCVQYKDRKSREKIYIYLQALIIYGIYFHKKKLYYRFNIRYFNMDDVARSVWVVHSPSGVVILGPNCNSGSPQI